MKRVTMVKKIDNKSRHYCVSCGRKLYASDMVNLRITLLKRSVWACRDCLCDNMLSAEADENQVSKNLVLLISYILEK